MLIYDGSESPNQVELIASGLETGTSYAFKVSGISAVGYGVPSLASATVVVQGGASASQTTANGAALTQGFTGEVHEEQLITLTGAGLAGNFTLTTGHLLGASTLLSFDASVTEMEAALEGLAFTSASGAQGTFMGIEVSVLPTPLGAEPLGDAGTVWVIAFRETSGDVPLLYVENNNVTGADVKLMITEQIRGQANEFFIEPRRSDGSPVRDTLAGDGF